MRGLVPALGPGSLEDLANCAADDALTILLGKVGTFPGRSRFTTWAYKFAILQAANEVRRQAWSVREVELRDDAPDSRIPGPEAIAEATDLAQAVRLAMHVALTGYQRRIAIALLVDEVPIDVLADRLGTTRGALYKKPCTWPGPGSGRISSRAAIFSRIPPLEAHHEQQPKPSQRRGHPRALTLGTEPWLSCEDCFELSDEFAELVLSDPGNLGDGADVRPPVCVPSLRRGGGVARRPRGRDPPGVDATPALARLHAAHGGQ